MEPYTDSRTHRQGERRAAGRLSITRRSMSSERNLEQGRETNQTAQAHGTMGVGKPLFSVQPSLFFDSPCRCSKSSHANTEEEDSKEPSVFWSPAWIPGTNGHPTALIQPPVHLGRRASKLLPSTRTSKGAIR